VQESLARLQIPYVDLIQCHDIEFTSLEQVINETLPALQQLKAQGLVRFIGITGLPVKSLQYVMDRVQPGVVDVVLSYCHYCLNDASLAQHIPYFKEKQLGIINASPLSMGLLTPPGPPTWHPAPPEVKAACAAAAQYCTAEGFDIANLALQFAVKNPDIATTLVGMSTCDIVRSNIATTLEALNLSQQQSEGLAEHSSQQRKAESVLQEVQRILAPVKDVTWPSGRQENN